MIIIILARGGSKRCPRKNVMWFTPGMDQKNLVDIAIQHAKALEPERIILYTNILSLRARYLGDPLLFCPQRPEYMARDGQSSEDVLMELFFSEAEELIPKDGHYCLLQPTSPLRNVERLKLAKEMFKRLDCPALVSVNPAFKPNGAFYFFKREDFLNQETLWPEDTEIMVLPWDESIDIDNLWDFRIAQRMWRGPK